VELALPEQRAELSALASPCSRHGLALASGAALPELQRAFPGAGWQEGYQFTGQNPMGWPRPRHGRPAGPARAHGRAPSVGVVAASLSEIDLDEVRRNLGEDAARSLDQLAKLTRTLEEAGLIEQHGGEPS